MTDRSVLYAEYDEAVVLHQNAVHHYNTIARHYNEALLAMQDAEAKKSALWRKLAAGERPSR